ncbi:hemophore-related protein [Nocardia aurantiaca]|uniref:Hemophore-related protein n=1 Tax=Nocardia aurantiaca TaxID=2675850 RepID=A0A6I3LAC2_9NOCA|nr:hemophore-related protein [Nocardia aurantiaca]MTE17375.1 hemophore-related protein [Nocardia aurantiaca]
MKRTLAALLAGAAGAAAIALAVPGTASADTPQCGPQAAAAARADAAPKVAAYLAAHPDVAAEIAKVKTLPKDQRRAKLKAWRQANPQEAQDLRAARQAVIDYHKACGRHK